MKRTLKSLTLLVLNSMLLLSGCTLISIQGSQNIIETEYDINGFNTIDVSQAFTIEIIQSDVYKVTIKHNDNFKEHLNIVNHNETLKIGLLGGYEYNNTKLSAKIYLPKINRIEVSGASKINIPEFSTNNLAIELSGASKLSGRLNLANNLNIKASGASAIDIEGRAQNASLDFSGATELKGQDMIVDNMLDVDCSGTSKIKLTANGEISVKLSGASTLNYYGNGTIVKRNVSGVSSINKK
jgi:hypothetical protein